MINIITACSRPENLYKIYDSLKPFLDKITWWIIYDLETKPMFPDEWIKEFIFIEHFIGNPQKNYALNLIEKDWCYFLDDDNLLHPDLVPEIEKVESQGVLFKQQLNGWIRDIDPRETFIDQAQYILKRELIGNERYEMKYTADGAFIEKIYNQNKDKFLRIEKVLSYYNYLKI